ncbi:hypothetical protein M434DRAFT_175496 [Hypoxylon sp. CO27-5]|nr:hypothetical protein M434DRAFT_175496 [Hypoxylon sp. CO27-5]
MQLPYEFPFRLSLWLMIASSVLRPQTNFASKAHMQGQACLFLSLKRLLRRYILQTFRLLRIEILLWPLQKLILSWGEEYWKQLFYFSCRIVAVCYHIMILPRNLLYELKLTQSICITLPTSNPTMVHLHGAGKVGMSRYSSCVSPRVAKRYTVG